MIGIARARVPGLRRAMIAMLLVVLAGCASAAETATDDASTTTTQPTVVSIDPGLTSGDPQSVPTTNPTTETSVVPTTTTSTTTTTEAPPPAVNVRAELDVDPIFEPILDDLIEFTGVPIRLPADLGLSPDAVANLTSVDADHYLVHVGVAPDCTGGNVCRIATFAGHQADALAELRGDVPPPIGTPVPLPGGTAGTFHDAVCGANCGDGFVRWEADDVVYSVGAKLAPGPDMLAWAWSALEPSSEPPVPPEFCGPDTVADDGRVADVLDAGVTGSDLHWLVVCSEQGLFAEVLDGPGDARWFRIEPSGSGIAVSQDDDTTVVFRVGLAPEALIDQDNFERLVVTDLRCADVNGDGRTELADAATDRVFELSNMAAELEVAADVEALPPC